MKQCLRLEIGLPYVKFKTIGDYIVLMCYYMKLLRASKEEQVSSIENQTRYYREKVAKNPNWTLQEINADDGITGRK